MDRLREMDLDDKVCEQVDVSLLKKIYPAEAIERCVGQSERWLSKARRVRQSTLLALVLFVIGMALWSRLSQRLVWDKLVGKLSALHPADPQSQLSASALSARRQELGSPGLQALLHERCQVLAQPQTLPSAFYGRYRLMAIDGTLFTTADTPANEAAFGRSSNQFGKGAYPQVRCVLLAECGTHAVVELELSRYDVSEVHAAHRLLDELGGTRCCWWTPASSRAAFWSTHASAGCRCWGPWKPACGSTCRANDVWPMARYWSGSLPAAQGRRKYPVQRGLWVRILSYRVTDARLGEVGQVYRLVTTLLNPRVAPALELIGLYHERWEVELVIDEVKTHERLQRKVLRSKTPEGVRQELYGIFLAHYAVRALMAQAAVEGDLDPDRLSFTEGVFVLTETLDLALILEPEEATEPLLRRVRQQMVRQLLPERRLRVNRREVKQVYNKYKPKKRQVPPPEPFEPEERFLDFVEVLDPLATAARGGT